MEEEDPSHSSTSSNLLHETSIVGSRSSRLTCIIVPSSLSSNSFLELHVLLTKIKISAGFNLQQSEPSGEKQHQSILLSLANCGMKEEETITAPECMLTSRVAAIHGETNGVGKRKSRLHLLDSCHKDSAPLVLFDRSSDDGYNWRKYGQKVMKGSKFPRSYYKCAHPNCEVKKIFERSYTGQITEIVYKGTHDHPIPQSSRQFSAGSLMTIQEENDDKIISVPGQAGLSASSGLFQNCETYGTPVSSPERANDDNIDWTLTQLNIMNDKVDDDLNSKRRRTNFGTLNTTPVVKPIREPRVFVQTISEVDILDDGYRWRKYGQKVVRSNPNPRSYYKCTSTGCPVRKHVERSPHDLKAIITMYEGKHSHDLPTARSSSHDVAGPAAANGNPRIKSEVDDTICLDLVVGNRFS